MQSWYVYIAHAQTGYLYTGVTTDVGRRINQHNSGKGAAFARMHPGFEPVYVSEPMKKSEALKREFYIKSWSRAKKLRLIAGEIGKEWGA